MSLITNIAYNVIAVYPKASGGAPLVQKACNVDFVDRTEADTVKNMYEAAVQPDPLGAERVKYSVVRAVVPLVVLK